MGPQDGRDGFYIGELAERSGVTPDTIRYYEEFGVLPEPRRTESGYRLYGTEDVERLQFVHRAQTLGLRLEAISEILEIVEEGREPCEHVEALLGRRLRETEEQIRELETLRDRLREALRRARGAPAPEACRCVIIEGVDNTSSSNGG